MKHKILPAILVLSLTLVLGTVSASALSGNEADAVSGATQETATDSKTDKRQETSVAGQNDNTQKTFTVQELAKYNGKNGNKAYIAVNGTVYDVSSIFSNGQHHGFQAGQDLTAAFSDEHNAARLKGLPTVGVMQDSAFDAGSPLTQQEQTRLAELRQAEQTLEQKEAALQRSYYNGGVTLQEYLRQKAVLEAEEDRLELELDALENKAYANSEDDRDDDHDDRDDRDDDHDDRDDRDDDHDDHDDRDDDRDDRDDDHDDHDDRDDDHDDDRDDD